MALPYGQAVRLPRWGRLNRLASSHRAALEAAALALAAAVFLASVVPNLANHPTLTDDEAWVMSASYKLAKEGVFGSDMFREFYNADRHYYFNMPGHHLVLASVFKAFGAGVVQARLVGVAYGLATIGLTYALARKLYGAAAAVLTLGLLLFLRLNMGFDTGLPMQELAANVRYDLAPVPFMLAGILVLLGGNSWRRSVVAGGLFGVATLMQFYGAFMIPVALAFIACQRLPAGARLRLGGILAGGAAVVCLPYAVYALAHFDDYRGQASTLERRNDLGDPTFYFDSLIDEPNRFLRPLGFKEVPRGEDPRVVEPRFLSLREMAMRRPSAKLGVLVGFPLALAFSGWRAFRGHRRGDLILFLALGGLALQFALLDSLKLYIYWIPVVPLLCAGIAGAVLSLLQYRWGPPIRVVIAGAVIGCLALVFAEGTAARISGFRAAGRETDYRALTREIQETIPVGSKVVGSTSLWWGLRDTDYRSYFMFFYVTSADAGPYRSSISEFLRNTGTEYLMLTRLGQEELDKHLTSADRRDLEAYRSAHGRLIRRIEGADARSYGYVEIWQLTP